MRRRRIALGALAGLLVLCSSASAKPVTRSFTSAPITVGGYSVLQQLTANVRRPHGAGQITRMAADVVDARTGGRVPISRIMLHHILFLNSGTAAAPRAEAFYGDGEERAKLDLPRGYGYPVASGDRWSMVWMLMNHRAAPDTVRIRWTLTWETGTGLRDVTPLGFDASHGRQGLVYDVAGGRPAGSRDVRTATQTVPFDGRIVAGLGHVHGGAIGLRLTEPACGDRTLYESQPTWGLASHPFYNVRPVLHEPGPINMSQLRSRVGIAVSAGERLKLSSLYDAHLPHTRVMGLMLVYLARDDAPSEPCAELPSDVEQLVTSTPGRGGPIPYPVPLTGLDAGGLAITIERPPGSTFVAAGNASVGVGDAFYTRPNISIPQGASVTWRFFGELRHDVTVASGPRGFSSDDLLAGSSWTKRFTVAGTYKLFCALHPVQMTQVVTVRPGR